MKPLPNRSVSILSLLLAATALPVFAQTGPMVGTVKTTEAYFLYRPGDVEKPLRLSVLDSNQHVIATSNATSDDASDYVAKFHVTGLTAATAYTYKVEDFSGASPVQLAGPADGLRFKTRTTTGTKGVVTAAIAGQA